MIYFQRQQWLILIIVSVMGFARTVVAIPPPGGQLAWFPCGGFDAENFDAVVTVSGDTECVPGKVGRAMRFNGPGASLTAQYPNPIEFTSHGFTIEGWVYWDPEENPPAGNWILGTGGGPHGFTLMVAP